MKKFLITCLCITFTILNTYAYEDCIITTNGKITDIKIQHNNIIDVFPLITVMNDKNIIIIHPLKEGQSKFSVLKNNKEKFFFDVNISKEKTTVSENTGFESFTIDCPPIEEYFELDEPPTINDLSVLEDKVDLDEPPILKERRISD